jgi:hypothetical protein
MAARSPSSDLLPGAAMTGLQRQYAIISTTWYNTGASSLSEPCVGLAN